jgi:hypothetical protein
MVNLATSNSAVLVYDVSTYAHNSFITYYNFTEITKD